MSIRAVRNRQGPGAFVWLLVFVLAGAAGVVAYLLQPAGPETHRAIVVIGPPTAVQGSPAETNLFVVDVSERVRSDSMVIHVTEQIPALSSNEYLQGIETRRRDATSLVELSFTSEDRSTARRAVEATALHLLDESARTEHDEASFLLQQAEERLESANSSLFEFTQRTDTYDPETEFTVVLDEISAVDRRITEAIIEDPEQAAIALLSEQREDLLEERERLGSVLIGYRALISEVERARDALDQARARHAEVEFRFTTLDTPEELILARDVETFVDDTERLQRSALAAAAALVLSALLVVPLAMWLSRRLRGKHRDAALDERLIAENAGDSPPIDLTDRRSSRAYERR